MIRFKRLGYVALNVTQLAPSVAFYRDVVDLNLTDAADNLAFLRCSGNHHDVALYQNDMPGLARVSFELESPDGFDAARDALAAKGVDTVLVGADEAARLRLGRAFRFRDPAGTQIEIYDKMGPAPGAYKPHAIKIQRLGHCVVGTPNFEETVEFYLSTLNFKASDQIDGVMVFMRCFPNPFHHSFGIAKRPKHALHHVNFMVSDIDDIGIGRNRLLARDINIAFGPGRHMPSGSIFLYYNDPDGLMVEYSYGMEEFPEMGDRAPRQLPRDPKVLDMWGGRPGVGYA